MAELQCELLRGKAKGIKVFRGLYEMERLSERIAAVAKDLQSGGNSLISGIEPEMFAHPWDDVEGKDTSGSGKSGKGSKKNRKPKNKKKQKAS